MINEPEIQITYNGHVWRYSEDLRLKHLWHLDLFPCSDTPVNDLFHLDLYLEPMVVYLDALFQLPSARIGWRR